MVKKGAAGVSSKTGMLSHHSSFDHMKSDQSSVQSQELEKAHKRIADLETRIQDLTLQSTYSQTTSPDEDLSYYERNRLEEELKKARYYKMKADQLAVEAKVTAQRVSQAS